MGVWQERESTYPECPRYTSKGKRNPRIKSSNRNNKIQNKKMIMKTKQLFWTIVSFDGSIRNMTCDAERVAKEVMTMSQFNYAEAEYNGEVYTLDRGLGNYFSLRVKPINRPQVEVCRILEPRSRWIDVDPMGQNPHAIYLVKQSIYEDEPSEWWFESANEAEYAYDEVGDELLLILEQENGKVKTITIEKR